MDKKWLLYAGLILLGVIAAPKIRTLPLMDKLPTI